MTARPAQLRHGDIVRIRGERWRIVHHVCYSATSIVDAAGCDAANRAIRARFLLPFEPIDRLPVPDAPRLVRPQRWRHVVRRALAEACPSWASLRAATRAHLALIPFQLEPALALTRGVGCRFLIADAVGLGKTVQAGLMIAEALQRQPDARVLVVAPAGLREQWREELDTRFSLDAAALDAAGVARLAARLPAGVNPWSVQPVAITSIDYVKRPEVMRSLEALTWDVVVFDEAHNLAGRSDRAAAAAALGTRARALVLLTATPHCGDDEAFRRLCSVGDLHGAYPLVLFRRTRSDAGIAGARRATLLRVRPTVAETKMHDALMAYARLVWNQSRDGSAAGARLAVSVLARRACSSAGSLARSVERRIALLAAAMPEGSAQIDLPFVEGGDEEPEALLRAPGLRDASDERARLNHILNLACAAAVDESKLAALCRLVRRTDEPLIIFTEYRDTLQRLVSTLQGIDAAELHGGLSPRERADALRRFTDGTARLLLATDAASEGLNLHHRCRLVVNLELPWTPLRLEQRAGRVDRIGQARRVHVVHFVAAHTCEESTLARLARRISRIHSAIGPFGRLPDEQRVAESVLADRALPDVDSQPQAVPPGIITTDLRREAGEEAERIARARALLSKSGNSSMDSRAVIARVRRHRCSVERGQCFWVFKLVFTSSSGRLLWESLVPLTASLASTLRRSPGVTRSVLNPQHPLLKPVVARMRDERSEELRHTLRQPLHLWIRRERDLMATLRARHGRLSAGLLQRALFDRRDERLAASQALLLDEALSRSALRLATLDDCEGLRVEACDLVFGMVVD